MIKIVIFCFSVMALFGALPSKYDKEISKNKSKLEDVKEAVSQADKKIQQLANEIRTKNNELDEIQRQILSLNNIVIQNKENINVANHDIGILEKDSAAIISQKKSKEDRFVGMIAEEFSAAKAREMQKQMTLKDAIATEVYQQLNIINHDELKKLDHEYTMLNQSKVEKEQKIVSIKVYLKDINSKKDKLTLLQDDQKGSIRALEAKHKEYQSELAKNQAVQAKVSTLLKRLNVLKTQEQRPPPPSPPIAQQKKTNQPQRKSVIDDINESIRQEYKIVAPNIDVDVKKIGSSSGDLKIARYSGAKTIAPLKGFNVAKRFGKYYDKIYNIEFFNESVTLKATESDSKVFAVLPGKVIYEKTNQSVLDNVVIIQHQNGLHTIYSHLDKISPTVETGKFLEKGYVIGRVSGQLVFQVTQNSAFVDPLDLID